MRYKIGNQEYCVCDALVNQGMYISEDPIGHKCNHPATQQTIDKYNRVYDICDWCVSHPDRITLRLEE